MMALICFQGQKVCNLKFIYIMDNQNIVELNLNVGNCEK